MIAEMKTECSEDKAKKTFQKKKQYKIQTRYESQRISLKSPTQMEIEM